MSAPSHPTHLTYHVRAVIHTIVCYDLSELQPPSNLLVLQMKPLTVLVLYVVFNRLCHYQLSHRFPQRSEWH